ncbi:helix-turn-helix domain-containing protein [Polaromonas sp. P2-4]|nr:helix-turn-helix domain-containing protein [Polaromonas sp. P2-4]
MEKESTNSLDSVAVVAQLLDELAAAPAPMGVSEIARALNQSKARIHLQSGFAQTLWPD